MRLIAAAIVVFVATPAIAKDTHLCIPDYSTGFSFNKSLQKWEPTNFNVADKKYILWRKNGKLRWSVFGKPDDSDPTCSEFNDFGFTFCDEFGGKIAFNRKNLRYQIIYEIGYVQGNGVWKSPEGGDTPNIEIGTCSPL